MALDERLRRGLEEAGRPGDPSGVYEDLIRRRERRRIARRATRGILALAVFTGCVVGIVLLSKVFTDSPTRPAANVGEGVLFEDVVGEDSDLFLVQPGDSGVKQLTTTGDVGSGSWSPDGTRIVFPRYDEKIQSADLFVMNADGSDVRRLTDTPELSESQPRWSPDGSQIAFDGNTPDGLTGIYVMSADGQDVQRITASAPPGGGPDWSPDGSQLVFESTPARSGPDDQLSTQIWIMNIDGTGAHALTSGPSSNYSPRWSPDGDKIVFTHDRDVYVMNVDGTGMTNLTPDAGTDFYDRDAAWSSDGSRIVFASTRSLDDSLGLFTMNADGSDVRPVIDRAIGFCCPEPDWRGSATSATSSVEPEPSGTPTPSPGRELGLGFGVCNVSSIEGDFASTDERSTVYVATAVTDEGRCPQPDDGLNVVALDVDHNGKADAPFAPIECTLDCRAFSAPDIDGDGTDELLIVADGGAVVGLRLYDVSTDGDLAIVPVEVAEPGDPAGGFRPGEIASFLLGGDAFELYTLRCGDAPAPDGPGIVATEAEARPHDAPNADWHAHETSFVLMDDGLLHVVDTRDFTEPVTDDPNGPSFGSGETVCGSNLGPIAPIP